MPMHQLFEKGSRMSHQPPIPEAAQSPYPREEPPHTHVELPPLVESGGEPSISHRARTFLSEVTDRAEDTRAIVGVGAAIALGVAATVAALLLARRRAPAPSSPKGRPAAKSVAKRAGATTPRAKQTIGEAS